MALILSLLTYDARGAGLFPKTHKYSLHIIIKLTMRKNLDEFLKNRHY